MAKGNFPLFERPTPVVDALRERTTMLLEKPLVAMLSGGGGGVLPKRGTGLLRGTAGPRRGGNYRTFSERLERHESLFGRNNALSK